MSEAVYKNEYRASCRDMTEELMKATLNQNTYTKTIYQFSSKAISRPRGSSGGFESRHKKTCFSHIRTTKVKISLRIRAV